MREKGSSPVIWPARPMKSAMGAAVLPAHVNLALEDENHLSAGAPSSKRTSPASAIDFLAMTGQPKSVFKGQAVQRADVIDGLRDLFGGRGTGGWGQGGGKHPGTSGVQIQDSRFENRRLSAGDY